LEENSLKKHDIKIYGLIRVRNEELIIRDTLEHLNEFCTGGIFVFDDYSEDGTAEICKNFPGVIKVIENKEWDLNRERAEYENRAAILNEAKKIAKPWDWFVYLDADERVEFDWSKIYGLPPGVIAIRMKLFDFYITPQDADKPYYERTKIGPEYRKIIIAFKNLPTLEYKYMDQREVFLGTDGIILEEGYVKHYGKAISVEEWEKTCEYYSKYFPKYSGKWEKRKGKAIHNNISDFGNPLISWEERELKGIDLLEIEKKLPNNLNTETKKLKILLSTHHLLEYAGTEIYTYTLAEFLKNEDHEVYVYSKYIGAMKELFDEMEVPVVEHLEALQNEDFDIAIVNHNINAIEVRKIFPELPLIVLVHGINPFLEQPVPFDINVSLFLALSKEIKRHLLDSGINKEKIVLYPNIINHTRFEEQREINPEPQNILVISNKLDAGTKSVIVNSCARLNLNLKILGSKTTAVSTMELPDYINWADIVITLGRGAIESMMCGRIPLILDYQGGDGLVTPENFEDLAEYNFSGRKHRIKYDEESLMQEIMKYKPENGKILKSKAIEKYSVAIHGESLINLIKVVLANNFHRSIPKQNKQLVDFIFEVVNNTRFFTNKSDKLFFSKLMDEEFLRESINKSEEMIEDNKIEEAQNLLNEILVVHPEHVDVLNNLAVTYILQDQIQKAENILNKILQLDPQNEIAAGNLKFINNQIQVSNNEN